MQLNKTKKLALNSLFLALGLILHQVIPAFGLPMEPDMALAMLFIIILMNKDSFRTCFCAGVVTGIFTAITTKFPGGQLPNIIDKLVTTVLVFLLVYFVYNAPFMKKLKNKTKEWLVTFLVYPLGTLISGFVFLSSAAYIVGLPASFTTLVCTVVLPAVVINTITGIFLIKSIKRIL